MARITVDDCLKSIPNRFELTLAATYRARQLATELCQTADRALSPFGRRADRLRELSAFVAGRMR